jgi:hypothetical protein
MLGDVDITPDIGGWDWGVEVEIAASGSGRLPHTGRPFFRAHSFERAYSFEIDL